jgi:endoglucanase
MKKFCGLFLAVAMLLPFFTGSAKADNQVSVRRVQTLRRGININRWFSDPVARPASFYSHYVSLDVVRQIKAAGFTYIRVVLSPAALQQPDGKLDVDVAHALVEQMGVIEGMGLGVTISPERQKWDLANNAHDRELLVQFWNQLAPLLAPLDPNLTFVETLNEPNFPNGSDWDNLQLQLLQIIRSHLPNVTILATGNRWDNVVDLPKTRLLSDKNVVYVFHFYDPTFLTSTEVKDVPAQDAPALSALVFPVDDPAACAKTANQAQTVNTQNQVKWYCKSGWTAAKIKASIHATAQWARENQIVVANEEFGILDNRPAATRVAYLSAVREACEGESIGWGLWSYNDGFGFNINLDKPGPHTLDPAIARALGLNLK